MRLKLISFLFIFLTLLEMIWILPPKLITIEYEKIIGIVSMYNAIEGQTDESPLITASGSLVNSKTAACPIWLKFGSRIRVLGQEFICTDRMAKRYREGNYFDLIAPDIETALNFGRKKVSVELLAKL